MNKYTPRDTSNIEPGYCQCGCGQKTPIARCNSERDGWVKGEPLKYIRYHTNRGRTRGVREEVFWGSVDIGEPDRCWDWQGGNYAGGYGGFVIDGEKQYAHRVAWKLANKQDIPDGMVVMHSCDRKICVNPAHLSLGTPADNMADCIAKGRDRKAMGEDAGKAKLAEAEVLEIIRRLEAGGARTELANEYEVSYDCIKNIDTGKTWKHLR